MQVVYGICSQRDLTCFTQHFRVACVPAAEQMWCPEDTIADCSYHVSRTSVRPGVPGEHYDKLPVDSLQKLTQAQCPERNTVTSHPWILFNKTPEQLRRLGARGGKISGRNHRARRALMPPPPPPPAPQGARARESTVAAIARLDARFPWLRGAEKRLRKPSQ